MTEVGNLIDLSLEEQDVKENFNIHNGFTTNTHQLFDNNLLLENVTEGRPSLDNNPFDRVQKLACREMDPFDIVEKEACLKAREFVMNSREVKLGNLLSLSEENLTRFDEDDIKIEKKSTPLMIGEKPTEETPPLNISVTSCQSSSSASDSGSCGTKSKKSLDLRNRLLKLSVSNSSFNSPVNRKLQFDGKSSEEKAYSPLSAMFEEAAKLGEEMLGSESPVRLVDDDLMLEEPPSLIESDFEADLEMLRIPILKELNSPKKTDEDLLSPPKTDIYSYSYDVTKKNDEKSVSKHLRNLETLKARLKLRKEELNNNQDIVQLIDSLKNLISDIGDGNTDKKQQAAGLLETLTSTISKYKEEKPVNKLEGEEKQLGHTLTPPAITRQGTFDMDLQKEAERNRVESASIPTIVVDQPATTQSLEANPRIEDIPSCMFKSSATYDAETEEDKRDYILPDVDPFFPTHSDEEPISPIRSDVNDIVEQLGKLLGQHNFTQQIQNSNSNASNSGTQQINPTFIVVMNTSTVGQLPNIPKRRSFYLNNESSKDATQEDESSCGMRRRSQSLSLHDKVKIVTLPPKSHSPSIEQLSVSSSQFNISEQDTTSHIKTPAKMLRRNSFSNATTSASNANAVIAASAKRAADAKLHLSGGAAGCATQRLVSKQLPPLPMKRRTGNKTESVMKSSGPLKATLPIKKLAATSKATSPINNKPTFAAPETPANKTRPNNFNSSLHISSNTGRMSMTSTPMPKNSTSNLSSLNSRSMHSLIVTPMKKMNTQNNSNKSLIKPRYSATPNVLKPNTSSAAAAGLKRRSLTELKAKSPVKTKQNTNSSSLGPSTKASTGRSSLKVPTSRFSSRPSTSAAKNKENKLF